MNPIELKYYLFIISLSKCSGSCNAVCPKICVSKEAKDTNSIAFTVKKQKWKLKNWQNVFHVMLNANSIVQLVTQMKNGIIKHVNVNVKTISVMDIVSRKKTNNIATNVSVNCQSKKVRDCYILHSFISDHITIDNYHYLLSLCKA